MIKGRIIKQISDQYTVETLEGTFICKARGKFRQVKISPVVGDLVQIDVTEKVITDILPRKNFLERPVVANVDVALILTSVKKPDLSLNLLDKLLAIVKMNNIEPIICFSKLDLLTKEELKEVKKIQKDYAKIGYRVVRNKDLRLIKKLTKGQVIVLTGQSGAGKSTLLNNLDKGLNLETKPISEALNRGVHTTRHVELYHIGKSYMVDTPGFSSLEFKNVSMEQLQDSFIEFKNYRCSFPHCSHDKEKKCLVKEAVNKGQIKKSRYENYLKFLGEVNENNRKLFK